MLTPLSIDEILDHMDGGARWALHLAQREVVWKEQNITNLVDSLLRGFPIGTLLLVSTDREGYDLGSQRAGRRPHPTTGAQLLDGQQRCIALRASFGGKGLPSEDGTRHLWINVREENPQRRNFDPQRSQQYLFVWSAREDLNQVSKSERKSERLPRGFDSGWLRFADLVGLARAGATEGKIAPTASLRSAKATVIPALVTAVANALNEPRVPVHHLHTHDLQPADLHEVFIRLNAGGIELSAADRFFAGVKTYWVEAEEDLAVITNAASLYEREGGIRIIARTAGVQLADRPRDFRTMRLRDLAARQKDLVPAMRRIVNDKPEFSAMIEAVTQACRGRLGYGAGQFSTSYVDPIVVWSFERALGGRVPDANEWHAPLRYLFWSTALSVFGYGGGRLHREFFARARRAGEEGGSFPTDELFDLILGYQRALQRLPTPPPEFRSLEEPERRALRLMNRNRSLFLSVFQDIPASTGAVDVDHIYPGALGLRRTRRTGNTGEDTRWWVNQIGNLAILDRHLNRSLQDRPPREKLSRAGAEALGLTADEVRALSAAELALDARRMEYALERMQQYVFARSARIWSKVVAQFGEPPRVP